jgi:Uncharacterized protein conserved in bacteria
MTSFDDFIESLQKDIDNGVQRLPPVDKWHPELSGDMDMLIKRNGDWVHEGTVIQRHALVKLFSSILKKEGDEYFLVTPVEKWRIQVEDVPFQVTSVEVKKESARQALVFSTSAGDTVIAGPEHPLRVVTSPSGEPAPYLMIRQGMEGLIARSVFYELADIAELETAAEDKKKAVPGVYSLGEFYPLQ